MPVDRMAQALHRTGRGAPVVDLVAPPVPTPEPELADTLAALLDTPDTGELTTAQKAKIVQLERLKRDKREHEAAAKALGPDIEALQTELIELAVEHQLYDARGRLALPDVTDGKGFLLHPYDQCKVWPKYRDDPDTDQPYGQQDLIEALRTCGLDHLVVERTASQAWPAYVRERVARWHQQCGETGVTDAEGTYLDLDGEPLTGEEATDPVADILALPAALRAVIEPVTAVTIMFSRRVIASRAVAAIDAAEQSADAQ